ncbi:MAG: FKBP-type peptidyl-prolyl cis-trans isomerase [Sphingobacteriaceae bacterium]
MKKPLVLLSLLALALSACNRFKTGDGGLQYAIHTDKDGATIKEGDFIVVTGTQKTEKDSVLFSTEDTGRPAFLSAQKSQFKGDLFSAFAMLSEGDSATFKINLDTLALKTGQPKPPFAKDDHYLIFSVKIEKVIPKGKLDDQTFTNQINEYIKKDAEALKKAEPAKIKAYVAAKGLKLTTTASGLAYQVTKAATGEKAVAGDSVAVNYVGKFFSDKLFDTNIAAEAKKAGKFIPGRPYEVMKTVVGMQKSIPGFDEALMLFPAGTKVTVVMPSALAYGEQGSQLIPPYTPLVFDLEIVKVIKANTAPAVAPKK